jgi:hypothetical protein
MSTYPTWTVCLVNVKNYELHFYTKHDGNIPMGLGRNVYSTASSPLWGGQTATHGDQCKYLEL